MDDGYCAPPCSAEEIAKDEEIESRNIELDFGTLEIFKERTKYITFYRPRTDEDIIYKIVRNEKVKPKKPNFLIAHYQGILKPGQDFKLAVTYMPTMAGTKDVEVYDYSDSDYELIRITLSGTAIGPYCTLSTNRLEFFKTPEQTALERRVELKNKSSAMARFKVDYGAGDIFEVTPSEGSIKANGYEYIRINFRPKNVGVFAREITFLVWNCEPLILHVVGIFSKQKGLIGSDYQYLKDHYLFGFQSYFSDSVLVDKQLPSILISNLYMDFGSAMANKNECKIMATSFTNNINSVIRVNWNKDKKSGVFKIIPENTTVAKQGTVTFNVEFKPQENYQIYHETLMGQVEWGFEESTKQNNTIAMVNRIPIPLSCCLRVQGHSFPEKEGWIAQVELKPEVVYWQPCAPGETVSNTFLMRNRSHLPVMYKLIQPRDSNITAKPMMGKFRSFEIIAVQLRTEAFKVKTYIEEWKIILNGQEEKQRTIYFHGETCVPVIEVGRKNRINAGSVQDGTQKEIEVMLKNLSFYAICYKFVLIPNSVLIIDPMSGNLPPNDAQKLILKVTGSQCAPKMETFHCHARIINAHGAVSGDTHEIPVQIYVDCSYSELCACPSYHDFGYLPFGHKVHVDFEAVNFGNSPIFYQSCQMGDEQPDNSFRIKPCFGQVLPKEGTRFSIKGILSHVGEHTLQFGYFNRMIKDSPLTTGSPVKLIEIKYYTQFPIIKIDEISGHNFGPLFSNCYLYELYLQIPEFNKILREIVKEETKMIELRLPEFEIQDKEFYLKLALTNTSEYDTRINVQRRKICDCQLEEVSIGMSERKKGFNCPHRDCLIMELSDPERFLAQTTKFLTIRVKYCIKGTTRMCYELHLSNKRVVEMNFEIYAIPPNTTRLSVYQQGFEMTLEDVYLGTKVAPIQTFWMYNNTNDLLNFKFDTEDIEHMCRIDGFKVLEILNPVDQILPYHNKALLLKFHPIEIKTYYIEIETEYYIPDAEKILSKFIIKGNGIMDLDNKKFTNPENIPKFITFSADLLVTLSLEYVTVKALPIWNRRKELIFIKNSSKEKIVQYVWRSVRLDNMIEITTESTYGILQPREIHPVVITIKSFSVPCITTLLLPCEISFYSDERIYKSLVERHAEAKSRIDEFMQGEPSWAKRPSNPIQVPPKPQIMTAVVSIKIRTVHTKDLDDNMDPNIQLKQYPNQSVENIPRSLLKKYYPEEKSLNFPEVNPRVDVNQRLVFSRVLEEAISDVIYSKTLKALLELSAKSPLYNYHQFVMDDNEIQKGKMIKTTLSNQDIEYHRKKEIETFFNQLKITELSSILQHLIRDGLLRVAQCHKLDLVNLEQINEQIDKTLYVCRNKHCMCKKAEGSL
ncbi:uncharacterized protein LOC126742226 [Anthonomus grandis grandis]|uniref:uncharacterized protein LOC126742226 n=1 Tax=Anthonomus grandis grandis TaxID=2921223 RepID=UPI00216555CA|nr:uncharacterized protein LOC126742226 [Anthonomus grandis grandis]